MARRIWRSVVRDVHHHLRGRVSVGRYSVASPNSSRAGAGGRRWWSATFGLSSISPVFRERKKVCKIQDATDHNSRTESPVAFTGLAGRGFVICLLAAPANTRIHAVALDGPLAQQITQSTDSAQPVGRFLFAPSAVFTSSPLRPNWAAPNRSASLSSVRPTHLAIPPTPEFRR